MAQGQREFMKKLSFNIPKVVLQKLTLLMVWDETTITATIIRAIEHYFEYRKPQETDE